MAWVNGVFLLLKAGSDSYRHRGISHAQTGFDGMGSHLLHTANMKELILSPCWLGGKQILRPQFECDLPVPRLPHVAQVWLSASLKAAYGNQLAQGLTVSLCVCDCVCWWWRWGLMGWWW